jgi:hypothetical protein
VEQALNKELNDGVVDLSTQDCVWITSIAAAWVAKVVSMEV